MQVYVTVYADVVMRQKVYVCQYKTIPTLYMRTYVPDSLKTAEALAVIGSIVRRVAAQQSE